MRFYLTDEECKSFEVNHEAWCAGGFYLTDEECKYK